jgi:hypothetical protein
MKTNLRNELDEGYVSLGSFDDMENMYRKKFTVLKSIYEQRINQLAETFEKSCECLLTDEIVMSMTSDSVASTFVPSLLREIVHSNISCDRENVLMTVMEQENILRSALQSRTDELTNVRANITALEEKCAKYLESAEIDRHKFKLREDGLRTELASLSRELSVRKNIIIRAYYKPFAGEECNN